MDVDIILSKRYRIGQTIGIKQVGAIALSIYLAENLELPITPKPLCVIYFWQVSGEDLLNYEAIATKLYEIGQNYTLSPRVQAFLTEENNYYLVREYQEGYEYLEEFSRIVNDLIKSNPYKPKTSEASTVKALPIAQSWAKSLAKIPMTINRRQLMIIASSAIAGFTLAILLEKLKPQPAPIIIAEPRPLPPEPPKDPVKRGEKAFRDDLGNGIYLEMVRIPSGRFTLGSPPNEMGRRDHESPLSEVNVPAFYMAKFAVTQELWVEIMGINPALFRENLQLPVENISWLESQDFCRKLAERSPHLYRLPSESEWEYACRAGTNTAYHFGDNPAQLGDYAWFMDNANKRSHPIGQKVPNPWGLYEMHGGVWEWCEDVWHDSFNGAPADGSAWVNNGYSGRRVRKGGSWSNEARLCRSASREWHWQGDRYNDIGFRVVISAFDS
ncbi:MULTISPECIES: formylglycine-generating enzyme family protein [Pseudanabaena]|jgi:formylglycine-generating enzyme required for sulfatase activity|uniref:formylglycine-generating enzyme family protein n=1 Tax=Pseudanabaena TaxID=1152 RepID=UPI0024796309|nr:MULTISPECIES: formylglycine-generating enzyme family protein [Pseudanabaena]MEA5487931.1 formylglycine-generating enzyme family protein [Pseudanabaena sp. CCNP1317]WGS73806.1 formylglycine-generating enzyme family protein [Pseudanabaena galeata CCNP1313]